LPHDERSPSHAETSFVTLTQLRFFVAIADAGCNITQAAEQVHATQPGLSKQLKLLEGELGLMLFVRKGKSLDGLTPAGNMILEHARRLLTEAQNIRSFAANARRDSGGELRLTTTHTQARYVLPAALQRVSQRFPQVIINLRPNADEALLAELEQDHADIALISATQEPTVGFAVPLFRWYRRALLPADHALSSKGILQISDFATVPLITYDSARRADSSLRRAFEKHRIEPQFALTASDADLIKTYVRRGLGVGILAEMALDDIEGLKALDLPAEFPVCTTYAVLPPERVVRDVVIELIAELAPHIHRYDLKQALAGNLTPTWPEPPSWAQVRSA
jgi:DNA-binding transcriptional LysR family regulator